MSTIKGKLQDGTGPTVVDGMLNPCEPMTATASELQGITPSLVARALPWPGGMRPCPGRGGLFGLGCGPISVKENTRA